MNRLSNFAVQASVAACVGCLGACAQNGIPSSQPSAMAPTAATVSVPAASPVIPSGTSISYAAKPLSGGLPAGLDESYFQLIAGPVGQTDTHTITLNNPNFWDRLSNAASSYLFKQDEAVAVVLKLKIGDQDLGTRALVMVHPGDADTKVYGDPVISPWFRSADQVQVQFVTGRKITANSHLFQTLVPALVDLGGIYAGGNVLVKLLKNTADLDKKTKKVDSEFGKAFGKDEQFPEAATVLDVSKTGSYIISINGKEAVEVRVRMTSSILAPNGDPARMPTLPSEIQGKSISGKRVDSLVAAYKSEYDKNTLVGFAAFCNGFATDLAALGVNSVDRASILYSYLTRSPWNNKAAFRTDGDPCAAETAALPRPPLDLSSLRALKVTINTDRSRRIEEMTSGIWNTLPVVLKAPTQDVWDAVTSDNVSFVSLKYDVSLGGRRFEAGKVVDMNKAESRVFFQSAKLSYDKARAVKDGATADKCFSVNGTKTSSFRAYCFYPDGATEPLLMEFDFNEEFPLNRDDPDPNLIGVKFSPTH